MGLGSGISDPEKNLFRITYTGVKKALDNGSPVNSKLLTDDSVSDIENGNKIMCPKVFF
jgi:hypothetical protein